MKIIKQGAVRVLRVHQNTQSHLNIAKMYKIDTLCYDMDVKIGGKKKIQIILRDKTSPDHPTILSTDDDWAAFNQDDAIKVVAKAIQGEAILVYFNLQHMEQVFINSDLYKES